MKNNYNKLQTIAANELQQAELPQLNILVDNMLFEGLAILAGPPKSGKSWFSLQLGYSVCTGNTFLGRKTHQCDCLYLALEDSFSRLQSRLNIMLNGEVAPKRLFLWYHLRET